MVKKARWRPKKVEQEPMNLLLKGKKWGACNHTLHAKQPLHNRRFGEKQNSDSTCQRIWQQGTVRAGEGENTGWHLNHEPVRAALGNEGG